MKTKVAITHPAIVSTAARILCSRYADGMREETVEKFIVFLKRVSKHKMIRGDPQTWVRDELNIYLRNRRT